MNKPRKSRHPYAKAIDRLRRDKRRAREARFIAESMVGMPIPRITWHASRKSYYARVLHHGHIYVLGYTKDYDIAESRVTRMIDFLMTNEEVV